MQNLRVYLAEFFGTMMFVALGTGTLVFVGLQASPLPVAFAFGFAALAVMYTFGRVSGANINPAVSLAMALNKRMSWTRFLGYFASQILGALAGSAVVWGLMMAFQAKKTAIAQIGFGQTIYQSPINGLSATLIELFLTFVLVLVVLMVTSKQFGDQRMAPLAISATVIALMLIGLQITGASMNPARSLAPALFAAFYGNVGPLTQFGVYLIGPMVGAVLAALVAKFMGSEPVEEVEIDVVED
ncbi:MIP/aquaporin family protein [Weissella halotolerans]|uniref:Aquaporin Z n=1 Tax=Weissella halotolerans DSM 20190 TaxID=1123500 RepID=A0A0R2G3X6_9LACO|nr:MIP/aquaporin family protein [Weissella halotolerans]KRN32199.1 aquaporin Z [Weissella halotolerans DSM 20190]